MGGEGTRHMGGVPLLATLCPTPPTLQCPMELLLLMAHLTAAGVGECIGLGSASVVKGLDVSGTVAVAVA